MEGSSIMEAHDLYSKETISGETKLVCLIGSPVNHSMSPAMHTASFSRLGLDVVYLAFDVEPDKLGHVVEGLEDMGASGYNVTMPHKTRILPYLDQLSPAAELMGAVNTVKIENGKSYGYNTDGSGFTENLRLHGFDPKGAQATVLGAGGAGSAIYTQLALDGAQVINVFNNRDSFWPRAQERISDLAKRTSVEIRLCDLADRDSLKRSIASSQLLVNATRVGMDDLRDECLVDEDMLHGDLMVADTVYSPRETKLIKMAKAHGLKVAPGLGMLLQQAALGEKVWFDVAMPVDYIEEKFF